MRGIAAAGLLLVALVASGCGDADDGGEADTGLADAGADASPADADLTFVDAAADAFVPPMPEPPALPVLTPCPTGWQPFSADGVTTCAPYPATGISVCGAASAHFPGEPTCADVGTPCGVGDWATDLPAGATILYVKRGASPSGAGTMAEPLTSLSGALALATAGTIIAIDGQSYAGRYEPPAGVTLWGACAGSTTLAPSATLSGPIVRQFAGALTLRNLSIRGDRAGLVVDLGASATVRGVVIEGSRQYGIDVAGTLDARELVVRGVRSQSSLVAGRGRGILVRSGAQASVVRAFFDDNQSTDLRVEGTLTGSDIAARGTLIEPISCDTCGNALGTDPGSSTTLTRLAFLGQANSSINLGGGINDLSDLVVSSASLGGRVRLTRALIEGGGTMGGTGAWELTDLVMRNGSGLGGGGGTATLERVLLVRSRSACLYAISHYYTMTNVTLRDCGAHGIELAAGSVTADRLVIERAHVAGVALQGRGGAFTATNVRIEGTRPATCSEGSTPTCPQFAGYAVGVSTRNTGAISLSRFLLADNLLIGAQQGTAQQGTAADLDLAQGVVRTHAIGVNLQIAGYPLTHITNEVLYLSNGANTDGAALPLPPTPDEVTP